MGNLLRQRLILTIWQTQRFAADHTALMLNAKNPYAYFQAGVMANTAELRHTWSGYVLQPTIHNDQDILNSECQVVLSIYQLTERYA